MLCQVGSRWWVFLSFLLLLSPQPPFTTVPEIISFDSQVLLYYLTDVWACQLQPPTPTLPPTPSRANPSSSPTRRGCRIPSPSIIVTTPGVSSI